MSPLRDAVDEYLALRRGLGFRLRNSSALLRQFATFLEAACSVATGLPICWSNI